VAEYLGLLPTLLYILSAFAALFCVLAGLGKHLHGARTVWAVWAIYVPLVTGSCIYALSALRIPDEDTSIRVLYYCAVSLASIGFPLWCGARMLVDLDRRRPPMREPLQVAAAWGVSVATAPVGLLLMFVVDTVAAAFGWSPWGPIGI
jgi:hypothetical protein